MKKYVNGKYIDITDEDMKHLPRFEDKESIEEIVRRLEKTLEKFTTILKRMGVNVD